MGVPWLIFVALSFFFCRRLCATTDTDVVALQTLAKGWPSIDLQWSGYDPCATSWRGVFCDNTSNVNRLILNSGIVGTLLPAVGNLISLTHLDLSFNTELTGDIPRTLGNLSKLKFLSLQGCSFFGKIPAELGLLKNLQFLALNMNKLSGEIPSELGGLPLVYWFDVSQNSLSGSLPVSTASSAKAGRAAGLANVGLDNLTSAQHLHLFNNSFSGSLPNELTPLPKLRHLLVDFNSMSGKLPAGIGNLQKLEILRIDNNLFDGTLPASLNQLTALNEIHASNNSFSGTLPDLSALSNMSLIAIGNNVFNPQPFPQFILNLTKLQTIVLNQANLNGTIPNTLFQIAALEFVNLASNRLTGNVDLSGSSHTLSEVQLDYNNFTFVIGGGGFNLSLIGNPACSDPNFHFSDAVCKPLNSNTWNTTTTNATCTITTCADDKLLNAEMCSCAFPLLMVFQFNAPTFSTMSSKRADNIRLGLYAGLNDTLRMEQIWLADATFTNNHRLLLNVYFFPTKDEEKLKQEQITTIRNIIAFHQLKFPNEFGPYAIRLTVDPSGTELGSKRTLSAGAIAGIAVSAGVLVIITAATSTYAIQQKKRADKAKSMPFMSWGTSGTRGSGPQLKGARYFSFAELRKSTDAFSSSNELGVGGYGKVYKGILLSGEVVAIKRAEEGSMQGMNEFKTEIELLSRVHHKNLVGLVGFCYEHNEQMLVYEYLANGSLRGCLSGNSSVLNWQKRLEIALAAAKGLTYLHELANPSIIHRDVKSTNILLDQAFVAKVSDFGLSKVDSNLENTHISTQVKGTVGYLDPEYYMTQQLTQKSDVYSFGVVLLELITARHPIVNGKYIVREIKGGLENSGISAVVSCVDPNLNDYTVEGLEKIVEVAMKCTSETGSARPTMSEVVKELELLLLSHATNRVEDSIIYSTQHDKLSISNPEFEYSGGFQYYPEPK